MKNMESERHNKIPSSQSQHSRKRTGIEWPTIGLMTACYGLWFFSGFYVYDTMPLVALAAMAISVALHSSLQHEVLHGHPTRSGLVNEILISLPIGLVFPYRRYKHLHLKHHADERLTDPNKQLSARKSKAECRRPAIPGRALEQVRRHAKARRCASSCRLQQPISPQR